jgi:5'-3' exonuclease
LNGLRINPLIIFDYSAVAISAITAQLNLQEEIDENLCRHIILNMIRTYRNKFHDYCDETILALDSKTSWRKSFFPEYKAKRKEQRKSTIDWNKLYSVVNTVAEEIKDNFPYKVIKIDNAEADDIIGDIFWELYSKHGNVKNKDKKICIISKDKDFIQLQIWENVVQYSFTDKKLIDITPDEAAFFLKEQIIRGDKIDGIPNILSPNNTFVDGLRQKTISKKKFEELSELVLTLSEHASNYTRNATLIDLQYTPLSLRESIYKAYNKSLNITDKKKLLPYFMKHKLKTQMEHLTDF